MMMEITGEHFYSIAAIFSMAAYFLSNILWLRILLVVASFLYIISGLSLGVSLMVGWNAVYMLINAFHVVLLLLDKSTITLPANVKEIYSKSFSGLSTRQFKKLISMNAPRSASNRVLFQEGELTNKILVLLKGSAQVVKKEKTIATLDAGDLIGEMSFISKQPVSASVIAGTDTDYAYWTHADLERLERKQPAIYAKFIAIIGSDLVKKINKGNEKLNNTLV